MKRALVIPADVDQPLSTIEWTYSSELLPLLRGEIDCETVWSLPVYLDGAALTLWLDDDDEARAPELNARVHRFLVLLGESRMPPLYGTVVITEGADPDGLTLGLRAELLGQLQDELARAATGGAR